MFFAPSAGAERGVVGYREPSIVANSGRSADINFAGVGAADPHELYVLDSGGQFGLNPPGPAITEFATDGSVKRVLGLGVVSSGPDDVSETQQLMIQAGGGTFRLTFGGETTDPLDFDAVPATVASALNQLASIGGLGGSVTVTGGPGDLTGSNPYTVTFGGVMAATDEPLITVDFSALSGGAATGWTATQTNGEVGYEICDPNTDDVCKQPEPNKTSSNIAANGVTAGGFGPNPQGLAIDQETGEIYVAGAARINKFSADGQIISAFGLDVVLSGPGDSANSEHQQLTVKASGGSYTLNFGLPCCGGAATSPIAFDAPASGPGSVEQALNALSSIAGSGSSVSVSGGLTDPGGPEVPPVQTRTYDIAFQRRLAGDRLPTLAATGPDLTGAGKSVAVSVISKGGGAEVCTPPKDVCQGGGGGEDGSSPPGDAGSIATFGTAGLALAPSGSPNAGNVLYANGGLNRIEEFTHDGDFVRSFGADVVASGPDAVAGPDEQQQLTVKATGGTFQLDAPGGGNASVPIPYNAPANDSIAGTPGVIDSVEEAINNIAFLGGGSGSATVTGGPGNLTGSNPYTITFGGFFAGDDVALMPTRPFGLTISSGTPSADVTTLVHGGAFEICKAGIDICKRGTNGGRPDSIGGIAAVAEDSAGSFYAVAGDLKKLTPSGGGFNVSSLGQTEVQQIAVDAGAGQFRLSFGSNPTGTTGTGNTTEGSTLITNVNTQTGAFQVGRPFKDVGAGGTNFSRNDVFITAVGADWLAVDTPASATKVGTNLRSDLPYATVNLPYDAPANDSIAGTPGVIDSVEEALNALPSIASNGGSVTVTGGPGGAGGGSPYTVTWGGSLSKSDPGQIVALPGSTPLSGGSGPDADKAVVTTVTGGGPGDQLVDVAIGAADHILVAKRYSLAASGCASGYVSPTEVRIQDWAAGGATLTGVSRPCTVDDRDKMGNRQINGVSSGALFADPGTDSVFMLNQGLTTRTYLYADPGSTPTLNLNPVSQISDTGALLSGNVNPNGLGVPAPVEKAAETSYRVEFKKTSETEWAEFSPPIALGSGGSSIPFEVGLSGLTPNTEYEARVVVTKPFGFASVTQITPPFTTLPGPPRIDSAFASNVTATSADLNARINPLGTGTTYHFEYGPTPAYGHSTPETDIGSSSITLPVQDHIENLDSVVYHFRVVATNIAGSTTSPDQTFNFYPEPCPNAAVRQQTGANGLPDCRAYELVSPKDAGTSLLVPGGPPSPLAVTPARLSFFGQISAVPGSWNPPTTPTDHYVATRTDSGWETHFVGLQAEQQGSGSAGQPGSGSSALPADTGLNRFLQWTQGPIATYVWDWRGESHGRLPTNLAEFPAAGLPANQGGPVGVARTSADFSHYFYSSANMALAPGGLDSGAGSAYDNEIASGAVEVVSKLPGGADIPPEPGLGTDGQYLRLPAAADDGSHILMAAPSCDSKGNCDDTPSHLYMRVGNAVTYDVSQGRQVSFAGMSDDGSKVFFTSAEPLTADDADASVDLFMWSEEAIDQLTRVSATAAALGNVDTCTAVWTGKCGVEVVPSDGGGKGLIDQSGSFAQPGMPTDNALAGDSGSIYFYSPEQLVGTDGIPGRRNLYVAHLGQLHYVTTLDADNPLKRIQVSPDGLHAAFVTDDDLTAYDNAGFDEMYAFDVARGELRCISCLPSGDPPSADAEASQNGLFMSDDGRAFFATDDPLVPEDTNGSADVYEYVSGKSRLISSGVGVSAAADHTGLIGVSATGTDLYFSTVEALVADDRNGRFLRFYDARSGGGFPLAAPQIPCAAADECHGATSQPTALPVISSGAGLGSGGNVTTQRRKHHRKRHKKHHHKRQSKHDKKRHGKKKGKQRTHSATRSKGSGRR